LYVAELTFDNQALPWKRNNGVHKNDFVTALKKPSNQVMTYHGLPASILFEKSVPGTCMSETGLKRSGSVSAGELIRQLTIKER
jgi:hypothetical protein